MGKTEAKRRIEKLKKEIDKHRYNYHVLDKETISDSVLDSLKHDLYKLEQEYPDLITDDSPTQRVGGEPLAKFEKLAHQSPMLSMEDVFSYEEFLSWKNRLDKFGGFVVDEFFCMPKLDGLAVSLVYKNRKLQTAATRGNGIVGENITVNVKTISSVPLNLFSVEGIDIDGRIEVRGEIYFPLTEFDKLNDLQKKAGKDVFANPRNAAAGSVRQLDSKITASRGLAFVAWSIEGDLNTDNMEKEWNLIKLLGFNPVPLSGKFSEYADIKKHWLSLQKKRNSLNYWIDGMVIRVNDNKKYTQLGVVGKTPRGLVAWKFPAEETTTLIKNIDWCVGRTGSLTPVAIFDPTSIGGTTVRHASLHNYDEIQRLDVRLGDTVVIYKAGDIIPKVKEVVIGLRPDNAKKILPPFKCPVCDSDVSRKEDEVVIFCTNQKCFSKDKENILHAARAFNIDGLGPQIIVKLLESNLINRPSDLFLLKPDDISVLEGFGELSAKKLVTEIQKNKTIDLASFIVSLGIRNVGERTAQDIAKEFKELNNLMSATKEELVDIEGVGGVVAQSIYEYFREEHNRDLITMYLDSGVNVLNYEQNTTDDKLHQKVFVITGTLSTMSRELVKTKIRDHGGVISGSVSSKTDYLLAGENPGSKYTKAVAFGVKILSEKEFTDMLS